jgi:aryl-alcohol dehydrogenase (NADP+)
MVYPLFGDERTVEEGIGVIGFSPLAAGMLTGKHDPQRPPAPETRFGRHEFSNAMYWTAEAFASLTRLKQIAAELNVELATLAIAWALHQPAITAPIVGASKPEHLDASLAATKVRLSPDVLARIDEVTRVHRRADSRV